ncbi:hypothetical protein DSO57_1037863 [Entomophthora muscae]|uniref:Uncharacterized protein n=1 Tax=Entomophthora muscae TaxID=34485 RepID=A0ACC2S105_9FUNG|nr:hypothetical protein DSO57_1037863 [Entomophthora muscae]
MILPIVKFAVFSLAPFLLLLWSTFPDLWSQLSSSACLVKDDPSSILRFSPGLLVLGEALVKSLTCDDLDLHSADPVLSTPAIDGVIFSSLSSQESVNLVPVWVPEGPTLVFSRAPWLLTGLVLMGLNAYFSQLSLVSSLWSPLRAAVPVLHWVASWWFISLGWELNLVSLAPLSHTFTQVHKLLLSKLSVIYEFYTCLANQAIIHIISTQSCINVVRYEEKLALVMNMIF